MITRILVYTLIIFITSNELFFSQTVNKSINISLSVLNNFYQNEFHEYWEPGLGYGGELSFSHFIGEIGAGLSLMRFDKKIDSTKSFYGVDYYFLYRYPAKLTNKLNIILGFDFGIYEFRFDDDGIQNPAERTEREFAMKIVSGFRYEFADSWEAEFTLEYNHIYTKKEIELLNLRLGIVKSFSSPAWLSEFL